MNDVPGHNHTYAEHIEANMLSLNQILTAVVTPLIIILILAFLIKTCYNATKESFSWEKQLKISFKILHDNN